MNKPTKKDENILINNRINTRFIRIVGDIHPTQEISKEEAISIADKEDKDLILMSISSNGVGICKIEDYQKFIYEKKKKEKEQKKAQKQNQSELKEIRMTPNIDDHDFNFKLNHAKNFLSNGDKVLVSVFFKGREINYQEQGKIVLLKFADELSEVGKAENMPKLEGKRMQMTIKPIKK